MKHGLLVVLLFALLGSCLAQATFYVSSTTGNDTNVGDQSAPFATLGAALAAATSPNSTETSLVINVAAGIYTSVGNAGLTYTIDTIIQFYEESSVNGTVADFACVDSNTDVFFNAANNFVIDGNDGNENIVFNVYNCLTGVSFVNTLSGNTTYNDYLLQVLFTNFGANTNGVVSNNVYSVKITDSSFNGTTTMAIQAQGNGTAGGISIVEIDRTVFFNAGQVNINSFAQGILEDVTYEGGNAGAFIIQNGAWDVDVLTVSDSTTGALGNGGCLNLQDANITLSDSSFTNCQAAGNGGAIYFQNVDASLDSVTFTNNFCGSVNCVGGAYAHQNSLNTSSSMSSVTFNGNNATYGGAMELYGNIIDYGVTDLVFNNNTAVINGSCIDCCSSAGCGFDLNVTDAIQGSGNVGGNNITCTVIEDSSFSTVVSNSIDSIPPADNDDDDSNWWIWLIVILVAAAIIAVIVAAAGYFVYQKKKKSQYAAVD